MPSPETIASLKKTCVLALKKDMSFYFFAKAEDGEPALLIGKASAVRSEQKALAAKHKTKPVAQGSVKKSEDGGGLVFELLKGKPAALQKALKTTFGDVPHLKKADVQAQSKQVSLKDKLSGAFKGGDKAFARRADKLEEAIKNARALVVALNKDGVTPPEAEQIDDIENALEVARDLSETDPKDAYTALAPVKDRILQITQALMRLADDIPKHREAAKQHATTATTRLSDASKALKELRAAGYTGDEEATAISTAQSDIKAAQGRIQADPIGAGADLQKIAGTLAALKTAIDKKKGQSRASLGQKIEAKLKANDNTYGRRLAKVRDELQIVDMLTRQIKGLGVLTGADEKKLRALKEGLEIAKKSSDDSYQTGYAQLAKLKEQIAAFKQELDGRIALCTPIMAAIGASGDRIELARARHVALAKRGESPAGAETTIKGLLSALLTAEGLVASDPRQAQAVNGKLSAELDRFHQQLEQAEWANYSPAEHTFHKRVEEVRQALAVTSAAEEKLFQLCSTRLHKKEVEAIASLIGKSEALSKTSIKNATSTLKQARSYNQALLTQIQEQIRDYPKQRQALLARLALLSADTDHISARIDAIGDVRDLTKEKTVLVTLRKAIEQAEQFIKDEPVKAHDDLAVPTKTASQLRATLDQIFTDEAVRIDSAASGQEPPKSASQLEKNLALLRVQLRSAEALASRCEFKSSDQANIVKGIHERLAAIPAMLQDDPMQAIQEASEVSAQIQTLRVVIEGYQQGLDRILRNMGALTLEALPARKALWERFQVFCVKEFSTENIPLWQGIREKRFKSPKAKKMAYLEFLTPDSPSEANVALSDILGCFPNKKRPTQAELDDWDFWAQVSYDGLEAPLAVNLSDTYSRFKLLLVDPLKDEVKRSLTRDCPKIIAKWEARLA